MENENAIIKLVEELVNAKDEVSRIREGKAEISTVFRRVNNVLDNLITVILENTKLNYTDSGLTIKEDDEILHYVKFLDPSAYEDRLEELKKEAQERDKAAANLAENVKKEARKNGK